MLILSLPLIATLMLFTVAPVTAAEPPLAPVDAQSQWVRPPAAVAQGQQRTPMWGHANGLRVGIWPLGGPRGLFRLYTPYLDPPPGRLLNFIAVEPIVKGHDFRGLSEMEHSKLDNRQGKRFRAVESPGESISSDADYLPARGLVEAKDDRDQMSVIIDVERFENGAHVYVKMIFDAARPHEVGLSVHAYPDSKPLESCILSATMGNYARLRRLELADRVITPAQLWPTFGGDGFAPHVTYGLTEIRRETPTRIVVSATPDEPDPESASYGDDVGRGWRYVGRPGRQFWRMDNPPAETRVSVNARAMFWASKSNIPGGASFENFELIAPFEDGQTFWFGAEPMEIATSATQPENRDEASKPRDQRQ